MQRREALKNTFLILGYTVAAGTLSEIFSGCKNKPDADWTPSLLSQSQIAFLAEFAETILPKTTTPGAKDVKLERFVDQFLFRIADKEGQDAFVNNLKGLEDDCKAKTGKDIINCNETERKEFITQLEKIPFETVRSVWGMPLKKNPTPLPFYRELKGMLIAGYFTSEGVGKHVLRYDPVPGKYEADIPLEKAPKVSFE